MEGAIGIEQIKKLDDIIEHRIKNANYFRERIKEIPDLRIQKEIGTSSWFGFAMILENNNRGKRDLLVKLLKENKIEVRPIVAGNFTKNQAIKYMDYSIHGELNNANDIHDNGFFVGNHSKDNKSNVNFLIDTLKKGLL
jgi:CDP-6-deoxy-D-xylo-4-hexulose-3-dehydrase